VHDQTLEAKPVDLLRAAVQVSVLSIAWTTVANTTAVVLGVLAGSIVLVAFGLTGLLDAAGSVSLVVHFRHALHHEAFSARHERIALVVVTGGLVTVGIVTLLASAQRFATHAEATASPVGVTIAALSVGVLAALSTRKRRIARSIGSRALEADGWLSATGCLLAAVTVAGSVVSSTLGWWWADPLAASVIGVTAITVAYLMYRDAEPSASA
jgi:divalent metal cation (Fe/Co/Zn/Cd) transporter